MKKTLLITIVVLLGLAMTGCNKVRRSPGRVYMPDMNYSRAYETYASTEELKAKEINYNGRPVEGTIARGDLYGYEMKKDTTGLYDKSALIKSPLDSAMIDSVEAERLYLVNCAICHGVKLDGMGPLFNNGNGPFTAAPKNFMADDVKKMAEGTMFHSVTYGKNMMGSYASQLTTTQRWMVIHYIKEKQSTAAVAKTTTIATGAVTDTTGTGK